MHDVTRGNLQHKSPATFASQKFDLMNAVAFDQRLDPYAVRVFIAIIYHLNAINGRCFPSDELIAEMIGGSRPSVSRARRQLRECGYLNWYKTGRSNFYVFNFDAAAPTLAAANRVRIEQKGRRRMRDREKEEDLVIALCWIDQQRFGTSNRDQIRTADRARGHWPEILAELGIPRKALNGKHQSCLFCGGKDRAWFTNYDDAGLYYCNQCNPPVRDGFRLLMDFHHWEFKQTADCIDALLDRGEPKR
jgi:hypothetical protein